MTAEEQIQLEKLVKTEHRRLLGFIRRRVPEEDDALDIIQDVYFQLTTGFNDIREATSITAWLFAVARNRITDFYRKKRPGRLSDQQVPQQGDEGPLMLEEILPALTRSPEDEYMRGVIWERIEESLDRLPEKQREQEQCCNGISGFHRIIFYGFLSIRRKEAASGCVRTVRSFRRGSRVSGSRGAQIIPQRIQRQRIHGRSDHSSEDPASADPGAHRSFRIPGLFHDIGE